MLDFIGDGTVYGFSIAVIVAIVIAIIAHIAMTRVAARLAHPLGRRFAALGAQCRHPGPAHGVS